MARGSIKKAKEVSIFNAGSFFNERELSPHFTKWLLNYLSKFPSIERIMVESRCEFIDSNKMEKSIRLLDGKELTIGIGLESQDDHIRNVLIRKGLSKRAFENTVSLIHNSGGTVMAYVFLKPVGLSEKKALNETIKTIEYALSVGVDEIEISCAFIQENTPMAAAYEKGEFAPPTLWSILKIIELVEKNSWPVCIGRFEDEPQPVAVPSNCPGCTDSISAAIEQYRQTRQLGKIPNCDCR